jgi:hypothetical protein
VLFSCPYNAQKMPKKKLVVAQAKRPDRKIKDLTLEP